MKNRILVCSAWPYASGVPHLGNLLACLLSGGVFTRYYRLRGHEVLHVSGSDAHGTRIEFEALKQGISPEALCQKVHRIILDIIEAFEIDIDNYTTTESGTHKTFVKQIYQQMDLNGFIFSQEEERMYCEQCQKFLADRFVEGTCPTCRAEAARGNQCDACGTLLEPEELEDPVCVMCGGSTLILRRTKHWYLDLAKLAPELERLAKKRKWSGNVGKFTQNMLSQGLNPRAITRDLKWGIPAPFAGAEGKVIYVWAEAALGYVSATIEYFEKLGDAEGWKKFWLDDGVRHIYTQAKDNIPFHTLIFPGQLLASGQGYHMPDQIAAIEYLNWLGGRAFSKSRNIGLYCDEAMELLDPVYWRFYLLSIRPERKDTNFSWEDLGNVINGVFVDNISNFVNRVVGLTHRSFGGTVPDVEAEEEVVEAIRSTRERFEAELEQGTLALALRTVGELAVTGNEYFQRKEPWATGDPVTLYSALCLVKALSIFLFPFVPSFSKKIYSLLGIATPTFEQLDSLEPGTPIRESGPLLKKVDIEALKEGYAAIKERAATP